MNNESSSEVRALPDLARQVASEEAGTLGAEHFPPQCCPTLSIRVVLDSCS